MPQWRGSARRSQLPPDWAQRCQAARELYGTACYVCGHPDARDTDHVQPGNNHSISNLRPICGARCPWCKAARQPPCHLSKSGREGGQAKAARRRRPPEPHPGLLR